MMDNVMSRVQDHFEESLTMFDKSRIVGIFLQGSQNYGLQIPTSDVDTKLIVTPTFDEVVLNKKPVSTTHVRANDEHIDLKDIRLMLATFRKQNLNFIEILFTPYFIVNPTFADEWGRLQAQKEKIAHYSPYNAVKTMKGIAMEKYHAMEHEYPSKLEVLAKYGYDPKQLHHLLRVKEYLQRYINGESYEDCLRPRNPEYLIAVKQGYFNLDEARIAADSAIANVTATADAFCEKVGKTFDTEVDVLLDDVQYNIVKTALKGEILSD